jgi:GxxExxY protein
MDHPRVPLGIEAIAHSAVDAGLKVHTALGLELLESAYEHCLAYESEQRGIEVRRQVALPLM